MKEQKNTDSPAGSGATVKLRPIKASAGSGKTYRLTQNFVETLERCGDNPPFISHGCVMRPNDYPDSFGGILAITFTNLAAAEMRERVIKKLKEYALGKEKGKDPRKAERWLAAILKDMDSLNIRTIDSLLQMIVRFAALDLGLHPDFEPVFDSREALEPYLEIFLGKAAAGDDNARQKLRGACNALFDHADNTKFSAGESFLENVYAFVEGIMQQEIRNLTGAEEIGQKLTQICANAQNSAKDFLAAARTVAGLEWNKRVYEAIERIAAGDMEKCDSASANKPSLSACLLKNSPQSEALEKAFANYHANITRLASSYKILKNAATYAPFVEITQNLSEAYKNNMEMEGLCPTALMPGLAQKALEAKNGVSEAICRLGNRLTHFMIDEFQDTSRQQWDAIKPLVENALSMGGSLTWVGDIKQSIYGWRGAEPQLFDDIFRELDKNYSKEEKKPENLPYNRRSLPEIVTFNNKLFLPLAEKKPSPEEKTKENAPDASAPKATARGSKKKKDTQGEETTASFAAKLVKAEIKDISEDIINKTAEWIEKTFANTKQDLPPENSKDKGGFVSIKPVPPGTRDNPSPELQTELGALVAEIGQRRPWSDIMILCRGGAQASLAAETLINHGIPVITENSLKLATHPLVRQTIALLEFLDNPENDLAFWTIITGKLALGHELSGNLDKKQLVDWAARERKYSLYKQFRKDFPEVWQELFYPFHRQAGLFTPYDTVREWFARLDAEKRFPEDSTFARRLLEVIYLAETTGRDSIPAFLSWWNEKGEEEKAPMPEKMNAVRIMTIHKAKGLESPVVIVPWTNFKVRNQGVNPIVMECEGLTVAVPLRKYCGDLYSRAMASQLAENLNLLYVAFTRPKEELYIFSPPEVEGKGKSLLGMLLEKAGISSPQVFGTPGCAASGKAQEAEKPVPENAPATQPGNADKWPASAVEDWQPMQWRPGMKIFFERDPFGLADAGIFLRFCAQNMQHGDSCEQTAEKTLAFALEHAGMEVPEGMEQPLFESLTRLAAGGRLPEDLAAEEEKLAEIMAAHANFDTIDSSGRGTFLHFCLENMDLSGNADEAADQALEYGLACSGISIPSDPELRAELRAALRWFANLPQARHWLCDGQPEQPIMNAEGKLMRMDNIVPEDWGALIIDYKSGGIYPKHIDQLQEYIRCAKQCTGIKGKLRGLLIYLDKKCFRVIEEDCCHAPSGELPNDLSARECSHEK